MADPHSEGPIPLPAGRNRQPAPSRSEGMDAAVALLVGLRPPGSATAAILILIAARSHLDCRAAMEKATEPPRSGKRGKRRGRGKVTPRVVVETELLRATPPPGSQFKGYEP